MDPTHGEPGPWCCTAAAGASATATPTHGHRVAVAADARPRAATIVLASQLRAWFGTPAHPCHRPDGLRGATSRPLATRPVSVQPTALWPSWSAVWPATLWTTLQSVCRAVML